MSLLNMCNKNKFFIGQRVLCLDDKNIVNGGSAYINSIGKILTVTEIKFNKECNVYCFQEVSGGIFEYALISLTEHRNNILNTLGI